MKRAGQVILFGFPQADLDAGKVRPALLLRKLPGKYDDWLICMISGQTHQYIDQFDEIVREDDEDFVDSGLKKASVIHVGRLAVVEGQMLLGAIGQIASERLELIKRHLVTWLLQE